MLGIPRLTLLAIIALICFSTAKREIEISEDFSIQLEHCTEKSSSIWTKRGEISFKKRTSSRGNKVLADVSNSDVDKSFYETLRQECEVNGNYKLRFKLNDLFFYSISKAVSKLK